MRALVVVLFLLLGGTANAAEKFSGSNVDVRTTLAFKAPDAAVQKLVPEGWEIVVPAAGPFKGANLFMVLIDSVSALDADGKAVAPFRGAVLAFPARKKGTEAVVTMVADGVAERAGAPGAYGVYRPGGGLVERKVTFSAGAKPTAEETWVFTADDGHAIEARIQYERGAATQSKVEAKTYSGAKPEFYRIYKWEQVADLVRSAALGVDRVAKISIKTTGARYAPLFDGSEQLTGMVSLPMYSRSVFLPE
jgi:hypothetical protein